MVTLSGFHCSMQLNFLLNDSSVCFVPFVILFRAKNPAWCHWLGLRVVIGGQADWWIHKYQNNFFFLFLSHFLYPSSPPPSPFSPHYLLLSFFLSFFLLFILYWKSKTSMMNIKGNREKKNYKATKRNYYKTQQYFWRSRKRWIKRLNILGS